MADGRMAEGRFADPTAMALLREDENPWAHEAVRSSWTPAAMADLLRRHGFAVHRDDDLLSLARALPIPVHQRRSPPSRARRRRGPMSVGTRTRNVVPM